MTIDQDDRSLVFGVLGIALFVMGIFAMMAMMSSAHISEENAIPPTVVTSL